MDLHALISPSSINFSFLLSLDVPGNASCLINILYVEAALAERFDGILWVGISIIST